MEPKTKTGVKKTAVKKTAVKKTVESSTVAIKGLVKGLTKPSTIQRIATEKGLTPGDIFVRLVIEVKGTEYIISNKLRFLGENGYETLRDALEKEEEITVYVNKESKFFYLNKQSDEVKISDLLKKTNRKDISDLF